VNSVTFNGVNLTHVLTYEFGGSRSDLWALASPASGTHDIVVTYDSVAFGNCSAASYTGASGAFPDATGSGNGLVFPTSISFATTTAADNAWVVGYVASDNAAETYTAGSGTTLRDQQAQGGQAISGALFDSNGAVSPAGANTLTINLAGSSSISSGQTVSFAPAVAAGQPTTKRWGGIPHMGTQKLKGGVRGGPWGRTQSHIIVPRWLADERQAA